MDCVEWRSSCGGIRHEVVVDEGILSVVVDGGHIVVVAAVIICSVEQDVV